MVRTIAAYDFSVSTSPPLVKIMLRESIQVALKPSQDSLRESMRVDSSSPNDSMTGGMHRTSENVLRQSETASRRSLPVKRRLMMARCLRSRASMSCSGSSALPIWMRASVHPLMAELTRITRSFSAACSTISSTRDMAVAFATDEPPNLSTIILGVQYVLRGRSGGGLCPGSPGLSGLYCQ